MRRFGRWGQRLALPALAVGLLLWVAKTISWQEVWAALAQLSARDWVLLAAVNLAVVATFTVRWWVLLRTQGARVPYLRLLSYRLTAFGISYFTPGPHFGGEPYQVYAVARGHAVPGAISLAAVTLDKLIEMMINFGVLAAGVVVLVGTRGGLDPWLERQLLAATLLLLALPCALLVALYLGHRPLSALVRRVGSVIGRPLHTAYWAEGLSRSEEQAGWLCRAHPHALVLAVLATLVSWLGVVAEFWLLTVLMGVALGPVQVVTALVAARVALLLPLPAGLGALEAGQAMAMQSVGVDPSIGVAIALVIRARDVVMGLTGLALGGADVWVRAAQARSFMRRTAQATMPEPLLDAISPVVEPPHVT